MLRLPPMLTTCSWQSVHVASLAQDTPVGKHRSAQSMIRPLARDGTLGHSSWVVAGHPPVVLRSPSP